MGSVLAFQPREAASIKKPLAAGATASIVIFPGIRYERHKDDLPHAVSPKGDSRRGKSRPKH